MKKIVLIITILLITMSILFNPTKEDFNKKIHKISTGEENTYEQYKMFGIDKIYESGYERKNFYLFSIYKTNGKTNKLWDKEEFKNKKRYGNYSPEGLI